MLNNKDNILSNHNLIYNKEDFNNNHIIREFNNPDSNDFLPEANIFVELFDKKELKETYSWKITNNTDNILIINPGQNMIFRDNIYIIPPNETYEFMACILCLDPYIIAIVKSN